MSEVKTINIVETIDTPYCVDLGHAKKIYEILNDCLQKKQKVEISFIGAKMVITAFLNTAVGVLYKDFDTKVIDDLLSVIDIEPKFKVMWDKVIYGSPIYYKDKEGIDKIFQEHTENK